MWRVTELKVLTSNSDVYLSLVFCGGYTHQVTTVLLSLLDPDPGKRLDLARLEKLSRNGALWAEKDSSKATGK